MNLPSFKLRNTLLKIREDFSDIKPVLSILFIVSTLLSIVFFQMDERRLGYAILKENRELKKTQQVKRQKEIALMRITRPQMVENLAQEKLTLKRIQPKQIIHLTGVAMTGQLGDQSPSVDKVSMLTKKQN